MHAVQLPTQLPQPSMYGGVGFQYLQGYNQVPRPVPMTPQQVMAGQMVFGGDGGQGMMMQGPSWQAWQQGQAALAQIG